MPAFERVLRSTAHNAADQRVLVALEPELRRKLQEMSESIEVYQKGDHDSALESFRIVETRERTGGIREAISGMDDAESEQRAARSAERTFGCHLAHYTRRGFDTSSFAVSREFIRPEAVAVSNSSNPEPSPKKENTRGMQFPS
jgi:hypothetical protein